MNDAAAKSVLRGAFEAWLSEAQPGEQFWAELCSQDSVVVQVDTESPEVKKRIKWEVNDHAPALDVRAMAEKSEGVPL